MWRKMFPKRIRTEFSSEEVRTLKLREFETGNRLTIDKNATRHEFANSLTEIEREWLYRAFAEEYNIDQGARPDA